MNFRDLAQRASRGRVFKRKLPAEFGRLSIYVSPQACLRHWLPLTKSDPVLCAVAKELVRPAASVWDVGANVGLFSFCAAALAGKCGSVLAIEPDPWLCSLLTKSSIEVRGREAARVEVLCAAVSDANKIARLEVSDRSRASNHLEDARGSGEAGVASFSQACPVVSLDFLLDYFRPPSVVKIDVETHELPVLAGAARVLELHRPVIFCEVDRENSGAVASFLKQFGYNLYAADENVPRTPVPYAPWNTLAVPA